MPASIVDASKSSATLPTIGSPNISPKYTTVGPGSVLASAPGADDAADGVDIVGSESSAVGNVVGCVDKAGCESSATSAMTAAKITPPATAAPPTAPGMISPGVRVAPATVKRQKQARARKVRCIDLLSLRFGRRRSLTCDGSGSTRYNGVADTVGTGTITGGAADVCDKEAAPSDRADVCEKEAGVSGGVAGVSGTEAAPCREAIHSRERADPGEDAVPGKSEGSVTGREEKLSPAERLSPAAEQMSETSPARAKSPPDRPQSPIFSIVPGVAVELPAALHPAFSQPSLCQLCARSDSSSGPCLLWPC